MRNWRFIGIIIVIAVFSIALSIIFLNLNTNTDISSEKQNKIIQNKIVENLINSNIELIETDNKVEKVSPNCNFIFKTLYSKCNHLKVEKEQVGEVMVNKTRQDLEKIYKNWKVVTFRNDEVVFYKEEEGICNEHYLLKELNGIIAIYTLNEKEEERLKEQTQIVTNYLAEEDQQKLKQGIKVNGKDKLNKTLEDYE